MDSEDLVKNASKDDVKMMNSRINAIWKLLTDLQAKYDGKIFRLEEEIRTLTGLLSKRGPQPQLSAAPVAPPAAQPVPPPAAQPAQVPAPRAAAPAGDTGQMDLDKDELPQLRKLFDMKHQGFQRQNPAAPPVRKAFSCTLCKIQFEVEENLRKHNDTKHSGKNVSAQKVTASSLENEAGKKNLVKEPASVINDAVMQRIPIQSALSRQYNCLECPFQADGKGSSKSLLRHAKQTKHKTSSLEEKCYTCHKVCQNFEELMLHRRDNHRDSINFCRYLSEDSCKFGARCWYSHDVTKKDVGSKQNLGFRKEKESIPPDMMRGLTVLHSDLIAKHLEQKRPQGA